MRDEGAPKEKEERISHAREEEERNTPQKAVASRGGLPGPFIFLSERL
jgi:hypothetical protein